MRLSDALVDRLHRAARADRWHVSRASWAVALERALEKLAASESSVDVERRLASLHLEDLALATACADADNDAWEHFVTEYRPVLYRAASAIDPRGNARELADSIYGELFGLKEREGDRDSLFRYFHGRSSLATWLRSVLAQRHVDTLRSHRRLDELPDDDHVATPTGTSQVSAPDARRFAAIVECALRSALAELPPRDRLRLSCYYLQQLTLVQIGRMLEEHEGTVSRHLSRTRQTLREAIERRLRLEHGLDESAIDECFASVAADAGAMDLGRLLNVEADRKKRPADRSTNEGVV